MGRHTQTGFEPTPAIVRAFSSKDRKTVDDVHSTPYDSVTHRRGLGDSGYRVKVLSHDCPECGFDRMVRRHDVNPELQNEVRYWCLNPNCPHFVRDTLSHATHGNYPQRDKNEPAVMEGLE